MPRLVQAADVLLGPARLRRHRHFLVGVEDRRVFHRGALEVLVLPVLHHVHLRGVDGHGDLVGLGVELGQHVARVVGEPLGGRAFGFGREADRAAHLDDHLGHRVAHAGDQLVELGQALAALAVEFAHVQVQHGGAGVVAVHRLLDLLLHRDRDVLGKVGGHPRRRVGRGRDDQGLLVLGIEGAVEEVHGDGPCGMKVKDRESSEGRVADDAGALHLSVAGRVVHHCVVLRASGCPTWPRRRAASASAPGTRGWRPG